MENMNLNFQGAKVYRINLDPGDIMIVSIPSRWYNRANALEKVNKLTKDIEEHFKRWKVDNPILVLPDDISVFNLKVKELKEMEKIDSELDGFEGDFTL